MKVHSQVHGHVTVLVPHGPLVNDELIDLRRAVEEATASSKRTVLDMQNIPYMDSSGIELLLETCSAHLPAHRRPTLASLTETCMESLELTDILPRLEVFDTVENALRSCQK